MCRLSHSNGMKARLYGHLTTFGKKCKFHRTIQTFYDVLIEDVREWYRVHPKRHLYYADLRQEGTIKPIWIKVYSKRKKKFFYVEQKDDKKRQ